MKMGCVGSGGREEGGGGGVDPGGEDGRTGEGKMGSAETGKSITGEQTRRCFSCRVEAADILTWLRVAGRGFGRQHVLGGSAGDEGCGEAVVPLPPLP